MTGLAVAVLEVCDLLTDKQHKSYRHRLFNNV